MFIKQLIYKIKRIYHFLKTGLLRGVTSEIKYGFPARKLKVIVITGTDGKTTSSTLLYHVLKTAGKKVALLSTVAAYIGDQEIDTGFHVTTPDPRSVQKFFKSMVDKGIEYVIMEATSHGAYQYRTWGIHPVLAGLTNVTHEHLDYHLTYQNYLEAKAAILKKAPIVVLNEDDQSFVPLKKLLKNSKNIIETYSFTNNVYWQVKNQIQQKFPEKYNQMNAYLVYALAQQIGIETQEFIVALKSFPGVPGRMQFVPNNADMEIVVDFAHTPNALDSALTALKNRLQSRKKKGRLIAVYGCAGLRDSQKRPMMGKIGTDIADFAVFTAEDPRTENIWSIIRQMKEQLTKNHDKVISIADRKAAIQFALQKLAQPGDIVGIFGKGHEKSLCYGTTEYPWSDVDAVKEVLSSIQSN